MKTGQIMRYTDPELEKEFGKTIFGGLPPSAIRVVIDPTPLPDSEYSVPRNDLALTPPPQLRGRSNVQQAPIRSRRLFVCKVITGFAKVINVWYKEFIMGVPKQRKTKARQGNRRSHHALSTMSISRCAKCGKEVLPHRLCENCGTYRQREVVNVFAKLDKKEKKRREKEQKDYEKENPEASAAAGGSGAMEELSKK